ncbi:MAG: hypothetical protein M3174_00955 [Actinomycetota bacterium]|nr:hypothetical protein [Actinomycetota bacterium]
MSRTGDGGRARSVLVTLLAALGAAHLLLLSFKVRGLSGFSPVAPDQANWWGLFGLTILVATLAGVIAHAIFALVARPLVARFGSGSERRDLRTVWGLANFPAAAGFLILVLFDVLIGGREAYAGAEAGPLVTGWTAGSLAVGLSLGIWSFYLFVQGLRVAADVHGAGTIMVVVVAAISLAVAAALATAIVAGLISLIVLLVNVIEAVKK